jgi:hypothetical protein
MWSYNSTSFKTSVEFQRTTLSYIQKEKDNTLHNHRCENLKLEDVGS